MVFSSPTFLFLFLPLTLLTSIATPARWRSTSLLVAGVVFYVWGAGSGILVVLYVAAVSFVGARVVATRTRSTPALAAVVGLLLVPLGAYKYLPVAAAWFGAWTPNWVLPLGISFFTFHAISYLVDVARGHLAPERSVRDFLLYLLLFPHQIAGPIVRYQEIVGDLKARREVTLENLTYGCSRFAWGLAKKTFVADSAGLVADAAYGTPGEISAGTAWVGALAYAVQIYFDFSGYCDMAVGLAAMLGFRFPENFASPYAATGPADFWQRWHISLSRWFRDYVYIPLGGSRHGPRREYAALLATFALTALWHGAATTFLAWGALHAAALLLERVTGLRGATRFVPARRAAMLAFVVLSWVPFRAPTMPDAVEVWRAMLTGPFAVPSPQVVLALTPWTAVALGVGFLAALAPRDRTGFQLVFGRIEHPDADREPTVRTGTFHVVRAAIATPVLLVMAVTALLWLDFSPFLYFQF